MCTPLLTGQAWDASRLPTPRMTVRMVGCRPTSGFARALRMTSPLPSPPCGGARGLGTIRTCTAWSRNPALYPLSYEALWRPACAGRVAGLPVSTTTPVEGFAARMRASGGIRTPNLLIRSQMLYPLSYRGNTARAPEETGTGAASCYQAAGAAWEESSRLDLNQRSPPYQGGALKPDLAT